MMNANKRARLDTLRRKIATAKKALKNALKAGQQMRASELEALIARLEKELLSLTLGSPAGQGPSGGTPAPFFKI